VIRANRYFYDLLVVWGDGEQTRLQGLTFTGDNLLSASHTYTTNAAFNVKFVWLSYDSVMNCNSGSYNQSTVVTTERSKLNITKFEAGKKYQFKKNKYACV
jgi:hypothetical protein